MEQPFSLIGRTALITGGSRGIGRGIALAMAQCGADVAITYHRAGDQAQNAHQVLQAVEALGRRAFAFPADLEQTQSLHPLVDDIWAAAGPIHILVNNAGQAALQHFNEIDLPAWRHTFAVNLTAPFFIAQRVAEHMIDHHIRGRIISVSSKNGFVASAGLCHCNSSKGGLEMLSRTLAIELGPHGITANTLAPGDTKTQITSDHQDFDTPSWQDLKFHVPLENRLAEVDDVAYAAVFLASSSAAYMNGQHLILDGGMIIQQVPRLQFMPPYQSRLTPAAPGDSP